MASYEHSAVATADESAAAKKLVKDTFDGCERLKAQTEKLPIGDEYEYNNAFRGFTRAMRETTQQCLSLIDAVSRPHMGRNFRQVVGSGNDAARRGVVIDAIDTLLENVDSLLDEAKGERLRASEQLNVVFGSKSGGAGAAAGGRPQVLRHQNHFAVSVDNSTAPFTPKVYDLKSGELRNGTPHVHPYEDQIRDFKHSPEQLSANESILPLPLTQTPLRMVESSADLEGLIAALRSEKEFAVDLEHHSMHSYLGYTCLIQISTRKEDFIVDVIALRDKMFLMNEVFLDPKILKVFHGANEDIRWLQKDFGIYVANLFDTGIALQALHMPHSLAFCVDHFCQVKLRKEFQMADWRVRPLSQELIEYARQDTHYLLYCHDRLKALLLTCDARATIRNLLVHVFEESRRLCLTLYEKDEVDLSFGYRKALGRSLGGLSSLQLRVVQLLYAWRDRTAREADESVHAVMPNSAILQVASRMPTTVVDFLSSARHVSPQLRAAAAALVEEVKLVLFSTSVHAPPSSSNAQSMTDESNKESSSSSLCHHHSSGAEAKPAALHLPMTGTLPSLAERSDASSSKWQPEAHHTSTPRIDLVEAQPSRWFSMMQRCRGNNCAAAINVPLPQSPIPAAPFRFVIGSIAAGNVAKGAAGEIVPPQEVLGEAVAFGVDDFVEQEAVAPQGGDDDGEPNTEHVVLQPPDGATTNAVVVPNEDVVVVAAEGGDGGADQGRALPQSLVEEFGTARQTRRRAKRAPKQKKSKP